MVKLVTACHAWGLVKKDITSFSTDSKVQKVHRFSFLFTRNRTSFRAYSKVQKVRRFAKSAFFLSLFSLKQSPILFTSISEILNFQRNPILFGIGFRQRIGPLFEPLNQSKKSTYFYSPAPRLINFDAV